MCMDKRLKEISITLDDMLSLLGRDDVDGFLARKVSLSLSSIQEGSLTLNIKAEWFKSIYALLTPEKNGIWRIEYGIIANDADPLYAAVVLSERPYKFYVNETELISKSVGDRNFSGALLEQIVNILRDKQKEATFINMFKKHHDLTLIAASLQPHSRFVSGTVGGRRFVIQLGRVNVKDAATVTLHKEGILKPARFNEIYNFPLTLELVNMPPEELALRLLDEALVAEALAS